MELGDNAMKIQRRSDVKTLSRSQLLRRKEAGPAQALELRPGGQVMLGSHTWPATTTPWAGGRCRGTWNMATVGAVAGLLDVKGRGTVAWPSTPIKKISSAPSTRRPCTARESHKGLLFCHPQTRDVCSGEKDACDIPSSN